MTDKAKQLGNAYIAFDGYEPNGLKKREYLAGLAMQGILANPEITKNYPHQNIETTAMQFADALLEELAKDMPDWEDEDLKEE